MTGQCLTISPLRGKVSGVGSVKQLQGSRKKRSTLRTTKAKAQKIQNSLVLRALESYMYVTTCAVYRNSLLMGFLIMWSAGGGFWRARHLVGPAVLSLCTWSNRHSTDTDEWQNKRCDVARGTKFKHGEAEIRIISSSVYCMEWVYINNHRYPRSRYFDARKWDFTN